jgi:hypothetical protein
VNAVRFRQTWRQVAPPWLLLVGFTLARPRLDHPVDLAVSVATATAAAFVVRRMGVTVTPEEVVVHRIRSRHVPWERVEWVEHVRTLGGHGVRLVVDGRRIGLSAPVHTPYLAPDPAFEEKLATIQRYRDGG